MEPERQELHGDDVFSFKEQANSNPYLTFCRIQFSQYFKTLVLFHHSDPRQEVAASVSPL